MPARLLRTFSSVAAAAVLISVTHPTRASEGGTTLVLGHDVTTPALRWESRVPVWNWGGLYYFAGDRSNEPLLSVVGRGGEREEIRFAIPGAGMITMYGIAGGPDGSIAVVGHALSKESQGAPFVAWIAPDRRGQTVVRTWPYMPARAAIAADGVIWTAGSVHDETDPYKVIAENVVRRYDSGGKMLSSTQVRARGWPPGLDAIQPHSYLIPGADRLAWVTSGGEIIEFWLNGAEMDRFEGVPVRDHEPELCGAGLGSDGTLLLCVKTPGSPTRRQPGVKDSWQLLTLDRQSRSMLPALPKQDTFFVFAGFDGNTPVTLDWGGASATLHRYERTTPPAAK